MVKLDLARNYYADLELPGPADAEAVKKAYKKLALKYHPDRNPGNEDEAAKKFIPIQNAYEVLSNAEQKKKYDNYNAGSRFPRASGVVGNPYQDIGKNFPPPPRPPGFPHRPPMQKRQPTTSAADRYAEFAKDVPPTSRNSRKTTPAESTWKAWEDMKSSTRNKGASGPSSGSGASARPSGTTRSSSASAPPPVPPRTNPPKQPKGSFGNRPSRGYAPQSPGGDEPPVANSNYFTTRVHSNFFNETSSAARSRRRAPFNPDPNAPSGDGTFGDNRQSTPYQSRGGEKFDPYHGASNLDRSKSQRESNRTHLDGDSSDSSPTDGSRQRSSSVPHETDYKKAAGQSGDGNPNTRNSSSTEQVGNDANRKDKPNLYGNMSSKSSSSTHVTPQQNAHESTCGVKNKAFYNVQFGKNPPELQHLLKQQYSSKSSSEDNIPSAPHHGGLNAFEHKMQSVLQHLSASKYGWAKRPINQNPVQPQMASQQNGNANKAPNSFDPQFTAGSSTPDPHRFTQNSTDHINTRFVSETDATNWQFNAGSPVDETGRPAMPRTKSGSRGGRRSPVGAQTPPHAPFAQPPSGVNGTAPPQNNSFNPEEWSEKIGPQIFEAPKPPNLPNRPIRNASKKPKPVRMTAGTAGLVDTDESSSGQEDVLKPSSTPGNVHSVDGAASPNAMDVDPPASEPVANGARNIPLTPSRPEWRAGDVGGIKVDTAAAAGGQAGVAVPARGSEDSEEFLASFADLRNVEPLSEHATGLNSFGDLKSNLPFPSAAAGQVPIRKPVPKARDLNLPSPPKAPPAPPALAVQGLKPSAAAWKKYVDDFFNYMAEWHIYNTKFIDHFIARKKEVQKRLTQPLWLDSRDSSGLQEYMTWEEEDREVRAKWDEASNDHEISVRLFAAHREKMMK